MQYTLPTRLAAQTARQCVSRLQLRKLYAAPLPGQIHRNVHRPVPDPMARYKQLLFFATKLAPLPAEEHNPSNKVEGCVSQVWVVPEMREDGRIYWRADSDSALTKGLAALLVQGLSGCTPEEILAIEPDFIELLGLKQALTPSRNNGFLNMFLLMKKKTLMLYAAKQQAAQASGSVDVAPRAEPSTSASTAAGSGTPSPRRTPAIMAAEVSTTPIQDGIRQKITEALQPTHLRIIDESAQHAGHAAMRAVVGKAGGGGGETHMKVEVVSAAFEGQSLVKRHRMIYGLLGAEFAAGLHALALDTKTPSEAKQ